MAKRPTGPIAKAAGGAKLVGGLFVFLGGLPMLEAMHDGRGWIAQLAATATTLLLVGPGVWYLIAGIFLHRKQYWAIRTTYKVALGQIVAVGIVLAVTISAPWRNRNAIVFLIPAMLAVFFIPALIALLFDLRRAARQLLVMEARGFAVEALPVQTESLDA
jgi:hypothetical protein